MLDENIKKAINEAVSAEGQTAELAGKLISWIENLSEGNEQITSKESYARRSEHCFDATIVHDQNEY
ncbi:MAG: hypothetical protein EOO20_07430 [Chryseobacterium sp.]|nr:MAG: hypothetical protein EOO20_07430 [Chryseobacterium sp.]